ncbi:MAG TPA: hypothetical protein VJ302_38355 [Blastocatellia bacterium]|nr:hypothetical protein [Blastocatellia bacterium]
MLRIMEEKAGDNSTTLRLDGRIAGQWVGLLRTTCDQALQGDRRLTIDLGGVSFADREGVQMLQRLQQLPVTLINSSPFLQEQIRQTTGK